jgi:predicted ATPase
MEGKKTIRRISLENFLSFGSPGQSIELEPLNVLIGPNASGKSNFIEALRFLKATPTVDLTKPIREGGGANEYLWKGAPDIPTARIEVAIESPRNGCPLLYGIGFTSDNWSRLQVVEEHIEYENSRSSTDGPPFIYRYPDNNKRGILHYRNKMAVSGTTIPVEELLGHPSVEVSIDPNRSIIGFLRNPDLYPELAYLENLFLNIQFSGEWQLSRHSPSRLPQRTDLPTDVLWEDASNLGLILNNYPGKIRGEIIESLRQVYEDIEEIQTRVEGNTIQTFIKERELSAPTPAIRLSDGTLRYLCLLALLKQPKPLPILCIEEPEIGLHPDVIHTVAELLIEASQRTQLIVTTHSEQLVSALSDVPEAVIVCERDQDGTRLQRLDAESLQEWLEDYSLGDLWRKGELGGTRW